MDSEILHVFKERANYQRFKPYIQEHVLTKETQLIVNVVESYFNQFPQTNTIDWGAFQTYFLIHRKAQINPKDVPVYKAIFDALKNNPPPASVDDVLQDYITQDYSHRIADTALKVREGRAVIDDVDKLVAQYNKELNRAINTADLFVSDDTSAIINQSMSDGLEWRLEELNISCGPLRKGDFILVAAYVETGKTTFAASEVTHMATQIKDNRPIVWVNNEERSVKVMRRIQQAALGVTLKDMQLDPKQCVADYEKLMGMKQRILVTENDAGMNNVNRLTSLFQDTNPALIVFDQLDKVRGFEGRDSAGEHDRLGKIYNWARDLSHEYGPVIALSQCDATAEGSQYISMNQLRGSKVDKPGEADAIVTIGKTTDPSQEYTRFIHVPKNKLDGGARSVEKERHGHWEVKIEPEVARYVGTR